MNAVYLHLPNGKQTGWSMCTECGTVACPGNFYISEKCCTCYDCGLPLDKDERTPYHDRQPVPKWKRIVARLVGLKVNRRELSLYHRACEQKRRAEREAARLEKATLIENYDGPVYHEGISGSYGDDYCENAYELAEIIEDDSELDRPEFAFCCSEVKLVVRPDRLIEDALEDMDEDAGDRLEGVEELEKAVATFNEANRSVVSWYVDYSRKVRIPYSGNRVAGETESAATAEERKDT